MKYCAAVSDVQNVGVGQKLTGQRDEQVSASVRISIHDFLARASAAQTESDIFAVLWGGSREFAADVLPALPAGLPECCRLAVHNQRIITLMVS